MSTATNRTIPAPDWAAINHELTPEQRAAFNRFFGRIRELADEIMKHLSFRSPSDDDPARGRLARAEEMSEELRELTGTIPHFMK